MGVPWVIQPGFDMLDNDQLSLANDTSTANRTADLEKNRTLYRFYQDYLKGIPTLYNEKLGDRFEGASAALADAPLPQTFHEAMLSPDQLDALHEIIEGPKLASLRDTIAAHEAFREDREDDAALARGRSDYDGQTGVPKPEVPPLFDYLVPRGLFTTFNGRVSERLRKDPPALRGPADYQILYETYLRDSEKPLRNGKKVLGFPGFADLYDSDALFGWQRIAGTNPRVLMQLSAPRFEAFSAKMTLTDAHVQAVAGPGATVQAEVAAGRLYYCDYWLLARVKVQQGRYLAPAIGVFWANPAAALEPVAIQLQQTPGRVYTPSEREWVSARAYFQSADFNYHEMCTHLSEAHFAQEAFVIALRRNLPNRHPIAALLSQAYYALLYNNALGRLQLVNEGGYADKMMAGELEDGSLRLVRDYYNEVWRWDDWDLNLYLARQGTADTKALPVYPYRDDGLPLWGAIEAFAAQYVDAYYERDAVVANDRELGGFVSELIDPEKGNLASKGFPTRVETKAELVKVLARLLWQAGPGHGGINYSQYQYFGAIANAPGATYANFAGAATLPNINEVLPPIEQAIDQQDILNVLTQKVFGLLGAYDRSFHRQLNAPASAAVKRFSQALTACAEQVEARNRSEVRKGRAYVFLSPDNLPNSTNI